MRQSSIDDTGSDIVPLGGEQEFLNPRKAILKHPLMKNLGLVGGQENLEDSFDSLNSESKL